MPRPTVTKLFRNPRALSSALSALATLQPRALGFLNSLVTLVLASNYYVANLVTSYQVTLKFTYEHARRTLILLRKPDFYEEYTENNILPQKEILLQLHITCEKSNLVILLFT